jgi:hypothetical protein
MESGVTIEARAAVAGIAETSYPCWVYTMSCEIQKWF